MDKNEVPQLCWSYMPFAVGTFNTPVGLFIFELPVGTYLLSDPYDVTHGRLLGVPSEPFNSLFRRQYVFTTHPNDRIFLGTFAANEKRDPILQRRDSQTIGLPEIERLKLASFVFPHDLVAHSEHDTKPPNCDGF